MLFKEVSEIFCKIEQISSRIEITKLLSKLFSKASGDELAVIVYLSMGLLRAPYKTTQFGLAKKTLTAIISKILDKPQKDVLESMHTLGDLGAVIAGVRTAEVDYDLKLLKVYERLVLIESLSGLGSLEKKSELLASLLLELDSYSAQIVVRIVLGSLRLGFSDMTIVDAFSWMLVGDKSLRGEIENSYNLCTDLGKIAKVLKQDGIKGLNGVGITVGVPIRPAAAERLPSALKIVEKIGHCVAQPKLDGFRLQIHQDFLEGKKQIHFFSRNLTDMSQMFPDLVAAFAKYDTPSLIVEGEAIVYDPKTGKFLPFQETVKRKRKHGISEAIESLPLRLFLFDILYFDGVSKLASSHRDRRSLLLKLFGSSFEKKISVIEERDIASALELEDYFEESVGAGLEGLVVKRPEAIYRPGKRNFNWIKLKSGRSGSLLEDTIDCVILGYYKGTGKRASFGIGAFLAGVYNKSLDRFETIAKVGTGLSDKEWVALKNKCDLNKSSVQPSNVDCAKDLFPDVWVYPSIVCEVRADEITRSPLHTAGKQGGDVGLALRFPRFVGYRLDKSGSDATQVDEIKRLLENQIGRRKPRKN